MQVTLTYLDELEITKTFSKHDLVIDMNEIPTLPKSNGVMLEVHYFQPSERRFVFTDSKGRRRIDVIHPGGFIVPMYAIYAPEDCEWPGLVGIELYGQRFGYGESGFSLSGPGENERYNDKGQRIADVIGCICPRPEGFECADKLDYAPR